MSGESNRSRTERCVSEKGRNSGWSLSVVLSTDMADVGV